MDIISTTLAEPDRLRLRLDFFHSGDILLTRFGATALSYRIDPTVLRATFSSYGKILEPNTYYVGQDNHRRYLALFIPPVQYHLAVAYDPTNTAYYHIPLPPLWFFVSLGNHASVRVHLFALGGTHWPKSTDRLFAAPLPNVSEIDPPSGGPPHAVCLGNLQITADKIRCAEAFFQFLMATQFSPHHLGQKSRRYPENILRQWQSLHDQHTDQYPLDDLMATPFTIESFLQLEALYETDPSPAAPAGPAGA